MSVVAHLTTGEDQSLVRGEAFCPGLSDVAVPSMTLHFQAG